MSRTMSKQGARGAGIRAAVAFEDVAAEGDVLEEIQSMPFNGAAANGHKLNGHDTNGHNGVVIHLFPRGHDHTKKDIIWQDGPPLSLDEEVLLRTNREHAARLGLDSKVVLEGLYRPQGLTLEPFYPEIEGPVHSRALRRAKLREWGPGKYERTRRPTFGPSALDKKGEESAEQAVMELAY